MTCPDCERLQEKNPRLQRENEELRSRLAVYENPHTPPSRRRHPVHRRRVLGGPQYPGRPRGYPGRMRPRPTPDVVKVPGLGAGGYPRMPVLHGDAGGRSCGCMVP